jgi:hypothetical protein
MIMKEEINKIIDSLRGHIDEDSFELLETLVNVNEFQVCWEILIDLITEREDTGFLLLHQEEENVLRIAEKLNLKEYYILTLKRYFAKLK